MNAAKSNMALPNNDNNNKVIYKVESSDDQRNTKTSNVVLNAYGTKHKAKTLHLNVIISLMSFLLNI